MRPLSKTQMKSERGLSRMQTEDRVVSEITEENLRKSTRRIESSTTLAVR